MNWARLSQPSTWGGVITLLTVFGIQLSPENTQMIATVASSLGGALTRHANHCKEYRQTKSGLSQF